MFKKLRKLGEKLNPLQDPSKTFKTSEIREELIKKGISQDQVNGANLGFIYRRLIRRPHGADTSSIKNVLQENIEQPIDNTSPLWGVILETRNHPSLETVVKDFVTRLDIPVQIFHGNINEEFIKSSSISEFIESGKVILTNLGVEHFNAPQYNALFISKKFWEAVRGRNGILVFQTDTITCHNSDYSINDFMQFDYIGSKWPKTRPIGIEMDGGNGGLSLRNWKKVMECIQRFPPENWKAGEDGYFAFHLDLMGANVARDDDCAKFSTQHEYLYNSFGAHKISTLKDEERLRFLKYCPEAKHML